MSIKPSILLQHLAPKLMMTRLAGSLADCRAPWLSQYLIRSFIRKYQVNLGEALLSDPSQFGSFNEFFTRELKPGARPLADADWICPVDGTVSQFGPLRDGRLIQAKGQEYTAAALLGDAELAAQFQGGQFATLYLSPRDYHRIHMPCAGKLLGMRHIPGELFSVNPVVVEGIPGLFARNERLVCWFEHPEQGVFVLVLVGAAIVGSIATTWHGLVTPPRRREAREWRYGGAGQPEAAQFEAGQEMGRFQLGSTVVALLPPGDWRFNPQWQDGRAIRLGETMADLA
ncbi:archaetidylserine decarboxylase [Kerstersia similis]|uniref:archaetidylserine decarboxylase n=1 Tax=Kerstersia similis TaxID=206505 RepID=UPI0039F02957